MNRSKIGDSPSLIPRLLADARRLPPSLSHWEREGGAGAEASPKRPRGKCEGGTRPKMLTSF